MIVELTPDAKKDLSKLDKPTQKRIKAEIDKLRENPPPANIDFRKVLSMKDTGRMRAGDWRVFLKFDRMNKIYFVTEITLRRENTYD